MHDLSAVVARLERVERENRRLKIAGGAVVAVLAAVVLVGAVMPQEIPEVIEARMFRVVDENGESRILISAGGFEYLDQYGTVVANINDLGIFHGDENRGGQAMMSSFGFAFFDENGTERASMDDLGIMYSDENGKSRALMLSGGFLYRDENGTQRAALGAFEVISPGDRAETRYPAAVILSDAAGYTIWQAPR